MNSGIFSKLSGVFGISGKKKSEDTAEAKKEEDFHLSYEGQLAVDVYQDDEAIVVLAPLAGVDVKDTEITLNEDVLSIKGKRDNMCPNKNDIKYYTQECFWGTFSRSIVLPSNVDATKIKAGYKNGILRISVPFQKQLKLKTIQIEDKG